ncbi:hypothetical protein [Uliginosibacterium sp. H1]|uniref:hypothetical protein n=1 Tax=Uliginosibacterium sp. H1 TaxID=3114757 RepID=UPI002E16CE63|nr:hypothetical protein [Uliginosibacterium sp. H1]
MHCRRAPQQDLPATPASASARWRHLRTTLCVAAVTVLLAACGGSDDPAPSSPAQPSTPPAATPTASAVIGPAGGTLNGPGGVQVEIPPGALSADTTIAITQSSAGAPPLDSDLRAGGQVYAFTPHGISFAVPVAIHLPVAAAPAGTTELGQVAFASEDGSWQLVDATVAGGVATVWRSTFSWGLTGLGCAVPNPPPVGACAINRGATGVVATPANAMQTVQYARSDSSSAGIRRLVAPATLAFATQYQFRIDCAVGPVRFFRRRIDTTPMGPLQTIHETSASLTPNGIGPLGAAYVGSTSFAPLAFTHADNGVYAIGVRITCTRGGHTYEVGDTLTLRVEIPAPSVTHSLGGTVTGLTGTGLMLQNNGGDNLGVAANGAFTFATRPGAGSPYNVTVLTHPTGQACSVTNGSGTLNADVSNVAVDCVAGSPARAWQPGTLVDNLASSVDAMDVAFDGQGNAVAVWTQISSGSQWSVFASRYVPASGWSTPQRIDSAATSAQRPRVAADGSGNALVVWHQSNGTHMAVWSNRFSSGTWGSAQQIGVTAEDANEARLSMNASGTAMAAWIERQGGGGFQVRVRQFSAGSWGQDWLVSSGGSTASDVQVKVFASGTALATWLGIPNAGAPEIQYNSFNGTGWSSANTLSAYSGWSISSPSLAGNDSGSAVVAWSQPVSVSQSGLIARRYVSGSFQAEETLSSGTHDYVGRHDLAMNAGGQITAAWLDIQADSDFPWVRRYTPGSGWEAGQQLQGPNYAGGLGISAALSPLGQSLVVWPSAPDSTRADLYASDRASGGWRTPALLETNDDSHGVSAAKVVVDANGNGIAVWVQTEGADTNLRAAVFR